MTWAVALVPAATRVGEPADAAHAIVERRLAGSSIHLGHKRATVHSHIEAQSTKLDFPRDIAARMTVAKEW